MNRDDIPSTWEAALPVLITLYEYGDDTKRVVISEFMRMALEADKWRANVTAIQAGEKQ
jgi:hypothetical protein